jgi:2-iminoacetate synthase
MFPEIKISESEIIRFIENVRKQDVEAALSARRPTPEDFLRLISPAAFEFLPQMRARAKINKNMHYGKTVKLYTPLYLSNYCINQCAYCGFNSSLNQKRRRLSVDEAVREAEVISSYGIDSILLVSGEDPLYISVDYLEELVGRLKNIFSYVAIEIYPMDTSDYKRLFDAGVDGLTLYQETYDRKTYQNLHLAGPKADYDKRLEFMSMGAKAGFRVLGLGVLLGLYNWRIDSLSMIMHAKWLKKRFWKSKIQFSFPRITPSAGDFSIPEFISDKEFEQLILAVRIIEPESEISISTREPEIFREKIVLTAASSMSAASSVVPGGYMERDENSLKQFSLNDDRSVVLLDIALKNIGLDPVYKDWDCCI